MAPIESRDSQLSNGAKIIKIRGVKMHFMVDSEFRIHKILPNITQNIEKLQKCMGRIYSRDFNYIRKTEYTFLQN